ncbi:AraC family transcriptional regulator [Paenibacillus alginolyticus]|uniref:AraC family transcriptional regulator n=1 Tax=Paenibacillus alginolyticus TaxID=59839 RepID=UPI0003FD71C6|nr:MULTISPECIES: AraC family transcriptional regulator [Paenibacillus]MCY9669182.1 AraC family transcriptional regulator [Paenibacillus alginolyticus]NRF95386.1 helix-turn-helix transcriptional regulator [Paenibacillus frigoriresistens]
MKVYHGVDWIAPDEKIAIFKETNHKYEPEHMHTFMELVYIWSASGCHRVNGQSFEVQRGDLLFMNVGDTHSFETDSNMEYMNILFEPDFLSDQLSIVESTHNFLSLQLFREFHEQLVKPVPQVKFRGKSMMELEELLETMQSEYIEKKSGYRMLLHGYATILLGMMFRTMQDNFKTSEFRDVYDMLPSLLTYIEQHYAGHITLQDLAKQSYYSPYYISKVFKECFGFTFTEYVQQLRLREAKRKLLETQDSVVEIGRSVGYTDKTQFFRLFKQSFGMTPQQLRKM